MNRSSAAQQKVTNNNKSMKTLFKYLSAAYLFCAARNANAQTNGFTILEGKLSFSQDLPTACPLLQKGETASVRIYTFDAGKGKADLGTFAFTTTTTSGVPVTGEGTLF